MQKTIIKLNEKEREYFNEFNVSKEGILNVVNGDKQYWTKLMDAADKADDELYDGNYKLINKVNAIAAKYVLKERKKVDKK